MAKQTLADAEFEDALGHAIEGGIDQALFDERENALCDKSFDCLHAGYQLLPRGGAYRVNPGGAGPDSDDFEYNF